MKLVAFNPKEKDDTVRVKSEARCGGIDVFVVDQHGHRIGNGLLCQIIPEGIIRSVSVDRNLGFRQDEPSGRLHDATLL